MSYSKCRFYSGFELNTRYYMLSLKFDKEKDITGINVSIA